MENLYTKPSKILRTEISKNISNLQSITTDDISLVRRNIYNARRKIVPPLPKTMEELQKSQAAVYTITSTRSYTNTAV